jgi:hypothetical protein
MEITLGGVAVPQSVVLLWALGLWVWDVFWDDC